jgi:3-oxoacyl-[acyl-carrier protein] reductase
MSKAIAYEVASRGITVNCVAPGFIETAMTDKLNDDQKAAILGQVPAGRMGDARRDRGGGALSRQPEAAYVTGRRST